MNRKLKILVADDSANIVKLVASRLELAGYEVIQAFDGLGAIDAVESRKPDLIVLDWKMPFGSGDSVMEYLHSRGISTRLPVIVMTGMKDPWVEESALSLGARIVLHKPYNAKDLVAKVDQYLKK